MNYQNIKKIIAALFVTGSLVFAYIAFLPTALAASITCPPPTNGMASYWNLMQGSGTTIHDEIRNVDSTFDHAAWGTDGSAQINTMYMGFPPWAPPGMPDDMKEPMYSSISIPAYSTTYNEGTFLTKAKFSSLNFYAENLFQDSEGHQFMLARNNFTLSEPIIMILYDGSHSYFGYQTPAIPITANEWHQYGYRIQNGIITFLFDGQEVSSIPFHTGNWNGTFPFMKAGGTNMKLGGGSYAPGVENMTTSLASVAIVTRPLSAAEISQQYQTCNEIDSDGDSVLDSVDLCPNSISDPTPLENHYSWISGANFMTTDTKTKQLINSEYTMSQTNGCTCAQILGGDKGNQSGQLENGCTKGIMDKYIKDSHTVSLWNRISSAFANLGNNIAKFASALMSFFIR